MPMAQMKRSAPLSQVASATTPGASCQEAATWVAPRLRAFSRLDSTGSMATTTLAPA
ncbi:MAG: hypothetical protein JWN17_2472 [Frankiales bacterium]|nr:hypothetical protein [Frankiales bacterium]